MSGPNWHQVADKLAERLMHHADCEFHDGANEDCPFCQDVDAYRAYLRAGGTVRRPEYGDKSVSIAELSRRTPITPFPSESSSD